MRLPSTRDNWEMRKELYTYAPDLLPLAERIIQESTDWLIARLYSPDAEIGAVLDSNAPLWAHEEAINWGDLSCVEVIAHGDGWAVTLEEASPDCVGLQSYIAAWLEAWGWEPVIVRTEW